MKKQVRIKTLEELKKITKIDGAGALSGSLFHEETNCYFNRYMFKYCGKVITIEEGDDYATTEDGRWVIRDWMIETKQHTLKRILDKTE